MNQLMSVAGHISNFLEEAGHRTVLEPLLQRAIRMNVSVLKPLCTAIVRSRSFCGVSLMMELKQF